MHQLGTLQERNIDNEQSHDSKNTVKLKQQTFSKFSNVYSKFQYADLFSIIFNFKTRNNQHVNVAIKHSVMSQQPFAIYR